MSKKWWMNSFLGGLLVLSSFGLGWSARLGGRQVHQESYPKLSPFSAVAWRGEVPKVRIADRWYVLTAIDGVATNKIIQFSRQAFQEKWRKRFEEDLVEVLMRMGHRPGRRVKLALRTSDGETVILDNVEMTEENRQAIRTAAQKRDSVANLRSAVPLDDVVAFNAAAGQFVDALVRKTGFSGVVMVAKGGEPVFMRSCRFAWPEKGELNTLDTPFRIASLTKQFTAAAVLYLEQQGRLSTEDAVCKHLPAFCKMNHRGITIHHLLSHTSGLPRIPQDAQRRDRWTAMARARTPLSEYVELAGEEPLLSKPGARFQYSNFGYRVLSAVIEEVAGMPYADFMDRHVFQALGMSGTGIARIRPSEREATIAKPLIYMAIGKETPKYKTANLERNFGTGYGSGGAFSTSNDLLRWDRVLASQSFLNGQQTARLFRPVEDHYAYGWLVKRSDLDGKTYHYHSGANEGYVGRMMRVPQDDLLIVVLGNIRKTDDLDSALDQLYRLCRSLSYEEP